MIDLRKSQKIEYCIGYRNGNHFNVDNVLSDKSLDELCEHIAIMIKERTPLVFESATLDDYRIIIPVDALSGSALTVTIVKERSLP